MTDNKKNDSGVKLFFGVAIQSKKKELEYQLAIKKLVENNKTRNKDFWDTEEEEMTEMVLEKVNKKIDDLQTGINQDFKDFEERFGYSIADRF